MNYKMCVPCLLGLEGPISDELKRLDIADVNAENGRVTSRAATQSLPAPTFACASESGF